MRTEKNEGSVVSSACPRLTADEWETIDRVLFEIWDGEVRLIIHRGHLRFIQKCKVEELQVSNVTP